MSNEEIFGIINYLNSLSFSEFELETGDLKIRIKRDSSSVKYIEKQPDEAAEATPQIKIEEDNNKPSILAPITGVYYQSSAPGEKPYVKVGDTVKEGDVLCILEAMKNMIEVTSDKSGQIEQILGTDGDSVEEGQALFIFKGE